MLAELLPPNLAYKTATCGSRKHRLGPDQEGLIAPWAPRRRREFRAGRYAAASALRELGVQQPPPIGVGVHGEPLWPSDIVGSISHDGGYCAALTGWCRHWKTLGLDVERDLPLPEDARNLALSGRERSLVERMTSLAPSRNWCTVVFSVKEAWFKAAFALTGQWFDFNDLEIIALSRRRASLISPSVHGRSLHHLSIGQRGGRLISLMAWPRDARDAACVPPEEKRAG